MELLLHPGPEAEAWLRDVNKSDPSAQAIWDKYRISRARACAADALALPPESLEVENKLLAALHEVQELDVELSIWAHHLPASYQPEIWRLDSDGNATIVGELPNTIPDNWINRREDIEAELEEPSTQYIMNYGDMWYTSFWHNHRTSRLMLNETLIRLANRLNLPAIRLSAIATIQQMLAETCASFQHSLGDVVSRTDQSGHAFLDVNADFQVRRGGGAAAYLAVWSLRHVVSSDFAREDQIQMASAALQRISGQFGVRQALKLANRGFQCPALSARED